MNRAIDMRGCIRDPIRKAVYSDVTPWVNQPVNEATWEISGFRIQGILIALFAEESDA